MPHPAPILFAVLEYGEFPEMLRVAEALHERLGRPVVFWFVKASYRRLAQDSAALIAREFSWVDAAGRMSNRVALVSVLDASAGVMPLLSEQLPVMPRTASRRGSLVKWLALAGLPLFVLHGMVLDIGSMLRQTVRDVANFMRDMRRFRARYQVADDVLTSLQPALVVVGQDMPGTDLSFLLIAAGQRRVPRLMVPFAMFSLRGTADYAYASAACKIQASALNTLVAQIYPHWILDWRGERLLRLPGWRALALEHLGLIRGLPWTPLSEPVEALTAPSKVAAQTLVDLGVDRGRINVVGSPSHDQLAANLANKDRLKEKLCLEHGLDASHPLVVCGWPVNMFAWLAGRAIRYHSYDEVAAVWASALADVRDRHGVNVIVSVHPKTLVHEYKAARDRGLPHQVGGVDELIAASDLFTTLNGSSITAWAIACAVPVLLFDCFETRYEDFNQVPGCILVQDEQEFFNQLSRLCGDLDARMALTERQREIAECWGVLDGEASTRIAELASRLIGAGSA